MKLSRRAERFKEHGQGQRQGRGGLITVGPALRIGQFQGSETEPSSTIDKTDQTLTELHADSTISVLAEVEAAQRELWDALMTQAETGSERRAAANLGVTRDAIRRLRAASRGVDHDAAVQLALQAMGEFSPSAPAPEPEVQRTLYIPTVKNVTGTKVPPSVQIARELKLCPYPQELDENFNLRWLPYLRQWGWLLRRQGRISWVMLRNGEIVTTRSAWGPELFGAWRVLGGPDADAADHGFLGRLAAVLEFDNRLRRELEKRRNQKSSS